MSEDAILVKQYLGGDENALSTLVRMHIDAVYAFALRMTNDPELAEDVTQQTFVNAWKRLSSYDTERRFITWLLAIARNAAIDTLRKKKSVPLSYFDTDEGGNALIDTTSDPLPLPDELFARRALGAELAGALLKLSFSERELLSLHYTEGLTFDEIGAILDKSRNTLKSQHLRALVKLRVLLATQVD
jgi:RNA polymerase sigma-70 factor, ECF subfamily